MTRKNCVTYRTKFKRNLAGWEVKCGDDPLVCVTGYGGSILNAIVDYQKRLKTVSAAYRTLRI